MTDSRPARPLALLCLSAVLFILAQPPFPTGWLGLVAFVPFLMALDSPGLTRPYRYGLLWAFVVNLGCLYWIAFGHREAGIASVIYLTLFDAIFVWLAARLAHRRRVLLFPFLWTAFIFVKSLGEMGFPWLTLGLTQTSSPASIQIASLTGAWGLELWIAGVNSLLFMGIKKITQATPEERKRLLVRALAPAVGLALVVPLYGRIVLEAGNARQSAVLGAPVATGPEAGPDPAASPPWLENGVKPLQVAVVQGSLRPDVKLAPQLLPHNLYVYNRLTRAVAGTVNGRLDLVIWPESAVPHYLNSHPYARRSVLRLQREIDAPILTGAFSSAYTDGESRYYNSAFLVADGRISTGDELYHKRILVPFGERVPYQEVLGFMADWSLGWSDFSKGEVPTLLGGSPPAPDLPPIGVLICYESFFTRLARSEVVNGARLLTVITNDAWFGRTSGPRQHLRVAALRAVEFRRPIVRAANSGISAVIDRWGQIHRATPLYTKTALAARVWPETGLTLYARTGDWLPIGALIVTLIGMLLFREPRRRRGVKTTVER